MKRSVNVPPKCSKCGKCWRRIAKFCDQLMTDETAYSRLKGWPPLERLQKIAMVEPNVMGKVLGCPRLAMCDGLKLKRAKPYEVVQDYWSGVMVSVVH